MLGRAFFSYNSFPLSCLSLIYDRSKLNRFNCILSSYSGKTTSGEIIAESQRKSQDFTPDIRTGQSDQSLGQPSTGDAGIASVTPGAGSPKNSQLGGKCVDHSACDPTLGISKTSYAGAVKRHQRYSLEPKADTFSRSSLSLEYFQPVVEDGRVRVKPPQGVTAEGCSIWENTKVGYFVGRRLAHPVVHSITQRLWGKLGLTDVLSSDNGFYFSKWNSEERSRVYEVKERELRLCSGSGSLAHGQPASSAKEVANFVIVIKVVIKRHHYRSGRICPYCSNGSYFK